ncbi:phosphocholine-specific phospholipase C [Phytomonospora endophytica]|uniref:phospholipase C n=1 Tax=Phytomonospora endophytica TaxID=714109 RepID=A0A841FRW1_9ACTN|nr:phospholipase C, phosphocholine-specific [Phytomonospora endophytica]MBB6034700.1 phospholipase C [Phytomonospora endophytica]GIG69098.1 phospholipase C, phosphocholine-specific [Phytomonospora endophytica]
MDRRGFLRSTATAAGATAAFALLPDSLREALAAPAPTGGLDVIEHVVVLMQENRSFDHYYGTLRGVRGFNDPTAITLPTGRPVYYQPNGSGYVLPYPVDDQFMKGTAHGWSDGHNAWNNGRHDQWIPNKGVRTMTTHLRGALPFYYQLADAFTMCDAYFCSENGPTNPNRFYLFSGTIGYEPGTTKRAIGNDSWQNPGHTGYTWTSYAERLEAAGISWRVYQEWDNYGDNSLDYFASFLTVGRKALAKTGQTKLEYFYYALADADAAGQRDLLARLDEGLATLTATERRLYDRALQRVRPDQTVAAFGADVAAGRLPAVSWIVAPEAKTEHPDWGPNQGAEFTKQLLDKLASNPAVWNKTVVFITYDENDGFFDHIPPPAPPVDANQGQSTAPVADDLTLGAPIGLGTRVPMVVVSPWTRGGNVCSQVFDHTSVLQFLEKWTGVAEPNISPWRRAVCGDLTSALDLGTANPAYPSLPTPVPTSGPWSTNPQPPAVQALPVQEGGVRPARALPYDLTVSGRVLADRFWLDFTNTGAAGAHFYVHAASYRTDGPWRYTVGAGKTATDYWQAGTPAGAYDLIVSGPNGFLHRFTGNRVTATTTGNADPEVTMRYAPAQNLVYLTMTNKGQKACVITVRGNNRPGGPWTYPLAAGQTVEDSFTIANGMKGWYDLTATADTADGFLRRFAGRVENGSAGISDPIMGSGRLAATVSHVDSQETASESGAATRAVDGRTDTFWHTKWSGGADPLPHELRLDLGGTRTVTGLHYLPRQDGGANGRVGAYELYLSADGNDWGRAVASGTFADTADAKTIRCWPTSARYVRFRALTEAGGRGPWTSAAEVAPLGW